MLFTYIADTTSSNNGPPVAFSNGTLSRIATAFAFCRAFAISSPGNGLNTLTFNRPAFMPSFLKLSIVAFTVPAVEFMQTITYSASSNLYPSKKS